MRIISGKYKGTKLMAPSKLPVRPTTDRAKESLFNILSNEFDMEGLAILDLFAGTGNISFEFASRGAASILAVDRNYHCVTYIKETAEKLKIDDLKVVKSDVFRFMATALDKYDIIFADPPYDMNKFQDIAPMVFEKGLLNQNGWLIIEHPTMIPLDADPHFKEKRQYGQSSFSIFYYE